MTLSSDTAIDGIVKSFGSDPSRLMDIVLAVQHHSGHVSDDAIQAIAKGLGVHAVEIEEMVSFYAFLDRQPRGRNRIRLSRTPIAFMKGAKEVACAFEQALSLPFSETSEDGAVTLEWTSDIGMADQEPSALVNGAVLTALTPADVPAIVAALRRSDNKDCFPPYPPHAADAARRRKRRCGQPYADRPVLSGPLIRAAGHRGGIGFAARKSDRGDRQRQAARPRRRGLSHRREMAADRQGQGKEHYVLCNADEGEPGTFKDRVLLSDFPDLVFDGMTIAGYAIGSHQGIVYLRGEYAWLWDQLQEV